MIAGTVIVRRQAGALPGYLMARGTIVLGERCKALTPTFADCGVHELVANSLISKFINPFSPGIQRQFCGAPCAGCSVTWP